STYVAFGAHYDHVGYAEGEVSTGADGTPRRAGAKGRVNAIDDRIWNGADDDGSGTVSLLALAKAFAEGPKPKRSLLFVWHTGEEAGLLGSRYFADYPTIPLDKIVAQLNIDMVGRNRDDKASEANTVYLVGSDRISTELHNINRAANASMPKPLTLDYEFNDPSDSESLYTRSDHYSYASKGIPIIFFTQPVALIPGFFAFFCDAAAEVDGALNNRTAHAATVAIPSSLFIPTSWLPACEQEARRARRVHGAPARPGAGRVRGTRTPTASRTPARSPAPAESTPSSTEIRSRFGP